MTKPAKEPAPCGTYAAYVRHVRRGEVRDPACRAASAAYVAGLRAAPPSNLPAQQRATRAAATGQVLADYAAGAGVRTIAAALRIDRSVVKRILTDAGVELRPPGEARAAAGRYRAEHADRAREENRGLLDEVNRLRVQLATVYRDVADRIRAARSWDEIHHLEAWLVAAATNTRSEGTT